MKKIFVPLLLFFISIPSIPLRAWYQVPYLNITINKTALNGDGIFNFSVQGYNPVLYSTQNLSITTENGSGTQSISDYVSNSDVFYITESLQPGWTLSSVSCSSNNPDITFSSVENGVRIMVKGYSSLTCNFINTKQSSKTPVLIVPGIMGTEIFKGTTQLWPDVFEMSKPNTADTFMDPLSYSEDGTPLDTSLTLGSVLGKPGRVQDYTTGLVNDFVNSQGYTEGKDLFTFPYDWRKDIEEIANQNLKGQIDYILTQTDAGKAAGKVDVIAHSQGGLVVKRLLSDTPEYQSKINKAVFVGVPNLGAPKAAKALVYGDDLDVSFLGLGLDYLEVKKIGQNMPSLYELLPSQDYFNHSPFYASTLKYNILNFGVKSNLNYNQTKQFLKQSSLNAGLIDKAEQFHSADFDNFDFSGTGIKAYNIVGCQEPTVDRITFKDFGPPKREFGPGDGTVPVFSANNIAGANRFFALESSHGTMMTQDGIRQQIINLISGSSLPTGGKITPNISECRLDGVQISSHSPVSLNIYDSNGKHVGPNSSGGFDYEIPGVAYDIVDHDSTAFLPATGKFEIKLFATGGGSFSFDSSIINNGAITKTTHFDSIDITASSTALIDLGNPNTVNIQLDLNGDGAIDQIIPPSSILGQNQSQDLIPPISTSTLLGSMGQLGFYRSDVTINLSATDPVIPEHESETSGILKTVYSLDGGEYVTYSTPTPITVITEGHHTLKFNSTDRAGNNEPEQEVNFIIDKTVPELIIQFSPTAKDIVFTATDTLPSIITSTSTSVKFKWPKIPTLSFTDSGSIITATDAAGNITQLSLKDKDRKRLLKAEVKSLAYNGQSVDMNKNKLNFAWNFDKNGALTHLLQNIRSKKNFYISAIYNGKKTTLAGLDAKGVILQSLNGLALLNITTNKGDLSWGY